MPENRPVFRPAQVIDEKSALEALESGDHDRIRDALVDGSRCLDGSWMFPHAWRYLRHENSELRWAACFALDQARSELMREVLTPQTALDDDSPAYVLMILATRDPAFAVRNMAATTRHFRA